MKGKRVFRDGWVVVVLLLQVLNSFLFKFDDQNPDLFCFFIIHLLEIDDSASIDEESGEGVVALYSSFVLVLFLQHRSEQFTHKVQFVYVELVSIAAGESRPGKDLA